MFVLSAVLVVLKLWFLSFVHFKVLFFEEDEILPLKIPIYLGKSKCTWVGQGLLESTSRTRINVSCTCMFLGCELTQEVSGSKRKTLSMSQGRQSKATGRD